MIKAISSTLLGFVLVFIEGFIIIKVKSYTSLNFGSVQLFMTFWALNICLVYSIINEIEKWLADKLQFKMTFSKK